MTHPMHAPIRGRITSRTSTFVLPPSYVHYANAFKDARKRARLVKTMHSGRSLADRGWTVITLERQPVIDSALAWLLQNRIWARVVTDVANAFRSTDITLSDGHTVLLGMRNCDEAHVHVVVDRLQEILTNGLGASVDMLKDLLFMDVQFAPRGSSVARRSDIPDLTFAPPVNDPRLQETHESPVGGPYRFFKRTLDIIVALSVIIATLPLSVFIALGIKLTSRGPVFFKQKRLGLRGVPFTMIKFRTMTVDSDERVHREYMNQFIAGHVSGDGTAKSTEAPPFKLRNDGRILGFGRFLRRWSLDELPQLLNVLKGEMSLVGPRPSVYYELESYQRWHHQRLEVTPGLTGMWQVHGRGWSSFDHMTRLDIRYIRNWSVLLDLKLLLFTAPAVLSRRGAA